MLIKRVELEQRNFGFPWHDLKLYVDKCPSLEEFVFRAIDLGGGSTLYAGHMPDGILTCQYAHTPGNETGFGGRRFTLNMEDGSQVEIKGPWSSRSSVLNEYCPELRSCEVVLYQDGYSSGLACYNVKEAAFEHLVEMAGNALVRREGEHRFYAVPEPEPEIELVNELGDILTERPTVQDLMDEDDEEA